MFCADTEEEAQARYDSVIANADWESANKVMDTMGVTSQSYGDQLQFAKERFITSGGGYPLVGNPEQVAAQLVEISKIGIDGMIFDLSTTRRASATSRRGCFPFSNKPACESEETRDGQRRISYSIGEGRGRR